jgi:hypothetical protein
MDTKARSLAPSWLVRRASLAVLTVALVAATAGGASAGPVTERGDCSGPSHWTLTVRKVGLNLRSSFSAAGGAAGQTWNVFADRNGAFLFAVWRKSIDGGSFKVNRVVVNLPGVDRFHIEAQNRRTGEICSASASF